jgi:hypothetical protein
MNRSALQSLLKKCSQGDSSALEQVVPKLADRLVVLPTVTIQDQAIGSATQVKVSIVTLKESDRSIIPIFTSMPLLKDWMSKMEIQGEGLSMSGIDVAVSLGAHRWMMVDPGTDYWCELEPSIVGKIAKFEPEDDWDDDLEELTTTSNPPPVRTLQKTQEVPIVPNPITQVKSMNPSNAVASFAPVTTSRLRTKDEENDRKATMDLTNLRKKLS